MQQLQSWLQSNGLSAETVLAALAALIVVFLAIVLINRMVRWAIWRSARHLNLSYEASLAFTRTITGAVWVLALLSLLNAWGVNIAGLWAIALSAAAVIGVGFLAVWTIVSNITASLFLTIWRPFHLGETIELLPENMKGRVIDRNMMFTAVRDASGGVLHIPNNLFFQKVFRVSDARMRSLFELLEDSGRTRENLARASAEAHTR
jgi:small-conductance mechanosensitive channel